MPRKTLTSLTLIALLLTPALPAWAAGGPAPGWLDGLPGWLHGAVSWVTGEQGPRLDPADLQSSDGEEGPKINPSGFHFVGGDEGPTIDPSGAESQATDDEEHGPGVDPLG